MAFTLNKAVNMSASPKILMPPGIRPGQVKKIRKVLITIRQGEQHGVSRRSGTGRTTPGKSNGHK
jgi:hypothetical protein